MAEARRRRSEYWAGLGAVVFTIVLTSLRLWPVPGGDFTGASVIEALLYDRVLLGVLRLAILVVALYGIASVPALVAGGRWAKGVGTGGIVADDARAEIPALVSEVRQEMAALKLDNALLSRERDELLSLLDVETRPN